MISDADYEVVEDLNGEVAVNRYGEIMRLKDHQWIEAHICHKNTHRMEAYINFKVNGERAHRYVSRLVAECFMVGFDPARHVLHRDGDSSNNHIDNLYQAG